MAKPVADLQNIAAHGGGLVLDAGKYSTHDLSNIAAHAKGKGSRIIIKNADAKSTYDLNSIAAHGGGAVVFDLT